jgi:hypothetical protein
MLSLSFFLSVFLFFLFHILRVMMLTSCSAASVKEALKRLNTCEIVTLDWLEDSMHKRKRLPEDPYSHVQALKRERERERRRLAVLKGLEKAVREVNPCKCSRSLRLGAEASDGIGVRWDRMDEREKGGGADVVANCCRRSLPSLP